MKTPLQQLHKHQRALQRCRACPQMLPPVVVGVPVLSGMLLVGQAPGDKEGKLGRPFAWTAGKTLFKWFESIGMDEKTFRHRVYMSAVCRCFPGKNPKGGDRVPDAVEIENCSKWLDAEIALLRPGLIVPVGKLAIARFMPVTRLADIIGAQFSVEFDGFCTEMVPLPHPSGASTWHRTEPGRELLQQALARIRRHPQWRNLLRQT
jgi:uracil-DNA glycosylase